jgi:hypothetical protein
MEKIVQRLERFFGRFEFGVYRKDNDDDKGAVWKVDPNEKAIPYLKVMNARGRHIFVRPTFEREGYYMMCDDLDKRGLERYHQQDGKFKPGRMVVETSPDNYQVWIRSERLLAVEEKSHWLKKMDSDPGASPRHRWGRAPGFRNRKEKYEDNGRYPLARLIWVDWKGRAEVPEVELPKQDIGQNSWQAVPKADGAMPGSLPVRSDFERGDNSRTDFAYALALMRHGVSRDEIEQRIRSERSDWRHHEGERSMSSYFKRTMDRAQDIISSASATPREDRGRGRERTSETQAQKQSLGQKMSLS